MSERAEVVVRVGGRDHVVPADRLDAVEPVVARNLVDGGFNAEIPAGDAEAFGRALFGPSWPAIVAGVADAAELGHVIRTTYLELAVASGRLPVVGEA